MIYLLAAIVSGMLYCAIKIDFNITFIGLSLLIEIWRDIQKKQQKQQKKRKQRKIKAMITLQMKFKNTKDACVWDKRNA